MGSEIDEVLELERRRCAAIGAGDMAALEEILADDYAHVFGDGGVSGKAGYIRQVARVPRTPERGELRVRLYGDTAVVTGPLINRVAYPDREPEIFDTFVTQVAVRKDGRWRFVSFQITPKSRRPA